MTAEHAQKHYLEKHCLSLNIFQPLLSLRIILPSLNQIIMSLLSLRLESSIAHI